MNKYFICILSVLFWSGCSKPTKQDSLDKILYQYEKNDELKDLINIDRFIWPEVIHYHFKACYFQLKQFIENQLSRKENEK